MDKCYSETSGSTYHRRSIMPPEDRNAQLHRCEHLKTRKTHHVSTVEAGYNDIGLYETSTIASDTAKWFYFEVKLSEVSYGEVLGDKSTMYLRVTLYWRYLIVLWLFNLVWILYCGCFDLFCNVGVCVRVGFVTCGRFGNMCTGIYCVLCCLYCVFCIVSFMYIYSYLFCLYWCKDYRHLVTNQLE